MSHHSCTIFVSGFFSNIINIKLVVIVISATVKEINKNQLFMKLSVENKNIVSAITSINQLNHLLNIAPSINININLILSLEYAIFNYGNIFLQMEIFYFYKFVKLF